MAITHYTEKSFAIELIGETYHTTDPVLIVAKVKETMDLDLTVSEVMDHLTLTEDFEHASNSIEMRQIFNEPVT